MEIDISVTFSVCSHPKILLPWQRDITTSPLNTQEILKSNSYAEYWVANKAYYERCANGTEIATICIKCVLNSSRFTPSNGCLSFSGNFFEILSAPFAHSLSLFSPWKMALTVDDILEKIESLGLYQLRLIFILSYIEFAMTLQVRMWCEIVSCIWYRIFLSFKRCFNLLFERNVSKNSHWTAPIYIRVGHVFESRVFRQQRFNRFLWCYWFSGKQKAILF